MNEESGIVVMIPREELDEWMDLAKKLGYKDLVELNKKEGPVSEVEERKRSDGTVEFRVRFKPDVWQKLNNRLTTEEGE